MGRGEWHTRYICKLERDAEELFPDSLGGLPPLTTSIFFSIRIVRFHKQGFLRKDYSGLPQTLVLLVPVLRVAVRSSREVAGRRRVLDLRRPRRGEVELREEREEHLDAPDRVEGRVHRVRHHGLDVLQDSKNTFVKRKRAKQVLCRGNG